MSKTRVSCFVDGFNLYHAIDDLNHDRRAKKHFQRQHLKWLDLRSLVGAFIQPSKEQIDEVFYFSAFATWLPDAHLRHRAYVRALEATGVKIILGNFKKKDRGCKNCGSKWVGHEEKESDVNLAIHLLHQAHTDSFDKAIIITADTDLVPAIQLVRSHFQTKQVVAAIPEQRFGNAIALRNVCSHSMRISENHLNANLLPNEILDVNGLVITTRPAKYEPPKK